MRTPLLPWVLLVGLSCGRGPPWVPEGCPGLPPEVDRTLLITCADPGVSDDALENLRCEAQRGVWVPRVAVVVRRGEPVYPPDDPPIADTEWHVLIRPFPASPDEDPMWDDPYTLVAGLSWRARRYAEVYTHVPGTGAMTRDSAYCPRYLVNTVLHEWGHLAGYSHSDVPGSLMAIGRAGPTWEQWCQDTLTPPGQ